MRIVLLTLTLLAAGCSVAGGGFKFCLLDHADLTLTTHHQHGEKDGDSVEAPSPLR